MMVKLISINFSKSWWTNWEYIPVELDPGIVVTNWQDEITRVAITNHYKFAINGGTDKHNYNASFSYQDREGIIKPQVYREQQRYSICHKLLKKFKTGFMMNVGYTNRSGIVSASTNNNQGRAGLITAQCYLHLFNLQDNGRKCLWWNGLLIENNNGDI